MHAVTATHESVSFRSEDVDAAMRAVPGLQDSTGMHTVLPRPNRTMSAVFDMGFDVEFGKL